MPVICGDIEAPPIVVYAKRQLLAPAVHDDGHRLGFRVPGDVRDRPLGEAEEVRFDLWGEPREGAVDLDGDIDALGLQILLGEATNSRHKPGRIEEAQDGGRL